MIKSMTGFGRAELSSAEGPIRVEIKSVNHKFLEVSPKLQPHLIEFEDTLRKMVSQELRRGKVNLFVSSPDPSVVSSRLVLNEKLAKEVHKNIKKLKHVLGLNSAGKREEETAMLREVLRYPNVLIRDVSHTGNAFSKELGRAVSRAIESLHKSRLMEGRAIKKDFLRRLAEMKKALSAVEKRIPALSKEYKKTLEKKMKELLPATHRDGSLPVRQAGASGGAAEVDKERLALDVALYVKNSDISEEVTRLKSHMDAMKKALAENGEVGRKIDFIGQEMYRESNTIGAKSNDVVIANSVIQLKSSIEKIREQAQNIE